MVALPDNTGVWKYPKNNLPTHPLLKETFS